MVCGQLEVNEYIVTSLQSARASTEILGLDPHLHAYIHKVGHKMDVPLRSSLLDMYSKCGSLEDAKLIFEGGRDSCVGLWAAMISGLAANEEWQGGLSPLQTYDG
ncbi:hypothetical protein CRG98_011687 [Punica granatum]|uniref:Pentatricopeptide repeat-containing protein n=1 Tax=Punica granatum TaxID=22663 RepID=A0A2I0KHZ9_PUNGR|nr:hypothetical protein CRG98_011687 [Punica granatum]